MTEAEKVICRLYLEDMDKNHTCNEYRLLMELLDKEPCEDAISKRDAIDALRTCYDTETVTYTNGNEYINYDQALDLIEALPSVESKIIRCKDCSYRATDIDGELYCRKSTCDIDEDGFCSWGRKDSV